MTNLASHNRIDFLRARRYSYAWVLFVFSAREYGKNYRPYTGQMSRDQEGS